MFQDQLGLPEAGRQYKGNLHSHTTNSDGKLTPDEAVALFRSHGYHFLCFSEHDIYTDYRARYDCADFIMLPGLEASAELLTDKNSGIRRKVHHMHGILGTADMQQSARRRLRHGDYLPPMSCIGAWNGLETAQELADTLRGYGCLVTYNHPVWSRVEPEEFDRLDGIWAMEIYNYNTVNECAEGADTADWDRILRSGRQIYGFASDDNHNNGKFDDACGGWIQVKARELSHEGILAAMLRGEFYSSSGPEIYGWGVRDDKIWISCSACERIDFICGGYVGAGTTVLAPTRDGLCTAELPLRGMETYVRVECVDYAGKRAWTNALFLRAEGQ